MALKRAKESVMHRVVLLTVLTNLPVRSDSVGGVDRDVEQVSGKIANKVEARPHS